MITTTPTTFYSCANPENDPSWIVAPEFKTISCNGDTYVSPFFGYDERIFPSNFVFGDHQGVIISFKLAFLDSWDGETFRITGGGGTYYSHSHTNDQSSPNTCGNEGPDDYETITFGLNHTESYLSTVLKANLGENPNASWGICDFIIQATDCPVTGGGEILAC